MDSSSTTRTPADTFIERWSRAEASERANAQLFLSELSDLLEVPRPSNTHADGYTFEFPVKIPLRDGSLGDGRIEWPGSGRRRVGGRRREGQRGREHGERSKSEGDGAGQRHGRGGSLQESRSIRRNHPTARGRRHYS